MNFPTTLALVLLVAAPAFADPPDGPGRANGPNRPFHGGPRGMPSGIASQVPPGPSAEGRFHGHGHGEHAGPGFHFMTAEMREKLRDKKFDPAEFKKQLAEWKEAREKRREEQRKMLISRWGAAIVKPTVAGELRLHAQRLARLQRFEELIATEKKGDERVRLLDRVQKMREREDSRHERAMQRLSQGTSAEASAEGSAAAPNASAPAASAAPSAGGGAP